MGRLGSAVHKQEKDVLIVFAPLPPTFADNCLYLAFFRTTPFSNSEDSFWYPRRIDPPFEKGGPFLNSSEGDPSPF